MTAIREQIFATIEARLKALPGMAEVLRMPSGDPISFPALHILDGGQDAGESIVGATGYTLSVGIDGYVKGGSGASVHAAVSNLYASAVKALMSDPPLGGLAETIDERGLVVWVAGQASERRMAFSLTLEIEFFANRFDPALTA